MGGRKAKRRKRTYTEVHSQSLEFQLVTIPHTDTIEHKNNHETAYESDVCGYRLNTSCKAGKAFSGPPLESAHVLAGEL
jgi:hypothetical protein